MNKTIQLLTTLNTLDGAISPKALVEKFDDVEVIRVPYLIAWFRTIYPEGAIIPETVWYPDIKCWISKVTIYKDGGNEILSKGSAAASYDESTVYGRKPMETAETAAIGRALRHAGFGTLYSVNEDVTNPGAGNISEESVEMSDEEFEDKVQMMMMSITPQMAKGVSVKTGKFKGKTLRDVYLAEKNTGGLDTIKKIANEGKGIEEVAAARVFLAATNREGERGE